jgi:hypothetical protein
LALFLRSELLDENRVTSLAMASDGLSEDFWCRFFDLNIQVDWEGMIQMAAGMKSMMC